MSYNVAGIVFNNVNAQNITISGVTVNGASAQEIAELILTHDKSIQAVNNAALDEYRSTYGLVVCYVDELRGKTSIVDNVDGIEIIFEFLEGYTTFLRRDNSTSALELIEAMTTLAMLRRLYGQYLQLRYAAESKVALPCTLQFHRIEFTVKKVDQEQFSIAETITREALRLCEDRLGAAHQQNIIVRNEIGLIHRDRGEYKQAFREFNGNLSSLGKNQPSNKRAFLEAYFNMAMVLRDRSWHAGSAYFLWSASLFAESAGEDVVFVKSVLYRQVKYALVYLLLQVSIFSACFVIIDISARGAMPVFMFVAMFIFLMGVLYIVLDRFILITLAIWFEGVVIAAYWPKRGPSNVLSDLAIKITRSHNAQMN
ncbi:hypothetical protein [Mesorhizobium sp. M0276]|uniref:hypothetical protein n=1 Tax=Mesorhizobium sp. M0276 TaxID=2956928 RepID=UPI0033399131